MNSSLEIIYDFIISTLSVFLIILVIVLVIFCCRKKPVKSDDNMEEPLDHPIKVSAKAYTLTEIDASTDGFNPRRIIGSGRLGTVYTGVLPTGELVAIKRIHPSLVLSNAGFGFSSIIKTLSLAQHRNIVSILGFSQAPGERITVTELVGMVSLDFYLHENSDGASLLDWKRRFRVAAGAARGLEYLHVGMAPSVVHGNFKSSDILLDERFCARVCDYGLSFLAPNIKNEKNGILGNYVDNNGGSGLACKESDVYGFGVVLLELLSGRRNEGGLLVKWALPLIKEMRFSELLDPRLLIPSDIKPIVRLAKVASACITNSRKSRPTIVQVAAILNSLEVEVCV